MAELKVELVGKGDVIVVSSPDLPKSLALSDVQFVELVKHLIQQAKPFPGCAIKLLSVKQER